MKKGMVSVLSMIAGGLAGAGAARKITGDKAKRYLAFADKHLALYLMMNQWVKVKQDGKNLVSYFEGHGYKRIVIYGMSYAGETLVNELKNSDIEIVYAIDQKKGIYPMYASLDIFTPDDTSPTVDVDAVVVTPITFFDEIEAKLSDKFTCPIISLEDILYEV